MSNRVTTAMCEALDPAKVCDTPEGRHLVGALALDLIDARADLDARGREIADAHAPLTALLDPAMPADLKGAVEYLIDHSNLGWRRAGSAESRVTTLKGLLRAALDHERHEEGKCGCCWTLRAQEYLDAMDKERR